MARKENKERPRQLLEAILQYLLAHGLSDLSLRPLARAVGASPRVLLYYFGSKERMVAQVLREFRRRQQSFLDGTPAATLEDACRTMWQAMSSPESEPLFRLFFEACGIALRRPRQFEEFLHTAVEDWLAFVAEPLCREGCHRDQARALATLILDGFRGFMLDLCVTGDRERVDRAVGMWLIGLDPALVRVREGAQS